MIAECAMPSLHEGARGIGLPAGTGRHRAGGNLVAFYSLSGHTRTLAEAIRDASSGRLEEIAEPRARRGFPGEMRALLDSLLRRAPPIAATACDPSQFELLLLGGPVWAGRIAAPVRSYARRYAPRAKRVGFFCTFDSDGASRALQDLAEACGRRPEAVLAVPAHALGSGAYEDEVRRFVRQALAAQAPAAA